MFDQARFGCILPEGLTVIATAFGKVISARNIDRDSDEADCLARRAVSLYMNGIREEWELELRLRNSCRQSHEHVSTLPQQHPGCGSAAPVIGLGEKPHIIPRGGDHAHRTNASTCDRQYGRVG